MTVPLTSGEVVQAFNAGLISADEARVALGFGRPDATHDIEPEDGVASERRVYYKRIEVEGVAGMVRFASRWRPFAVTHDGGWAYVWVEHNEVLRVP